MNRHKLFSLALLTTLLAGIASRWADIRYYTRRWPSALNIGAAIAGSLLAGLIFLQALDLLDDFIALFTK